MAAPDLEARQEQLQGSLSVVRPLGPGFETFIEITADGSITAFNGHVDLGTGIRTALGQIVAEELDVSFARIVVVLGDVSLRALNLYGGQTDLPALGALAANGIVFEQHRAGTVSHDETIAILVPGTARTLWILIALR